MAVNGYLKLLKTLKISNLSALSQLSNSTSSSSGHSILTQISLNRTGRVAPTIYTNESLCLEVMGILRRCFMHHAEVKEKLYNGLYNTVCLNSELGEPILDMLMKQFENYYVIDEDILPPLHFHKITIVKDLIVSLQVNISFL